MKVYFLSLVILLTSIAVYAQPISKDTYGKVIDYINYKVVELSIQDIEDEAERSRLSKALSDCECNTDATKLAAFLDANELDRNKQLWTVIDSEKGKLLSNTGKDEALAKIKGLLSVKELADFEEKHPNFETVKTGLLTYAETTLVPVKATPTPTPSTTDNPAKITPKAADENKGGGSSGASTIFTILLAIGLLALGGVAFMLFQKLKKAEDEIADLNKHKSDSEGITKELKATVERLEASEKSLKKELNTALDKVDDLEQEIEKRERATLVKNPIKNPTNNPETPQGKTIYETFYMLAPTPRGGFSDRDKSNKIQQGESVYEFNVTSANGSTAEFSLINDARTMRRAINGFDAYLRPVCESENGYFTAAKRIRTIEPGVVEKSGSKWILITKAKIRYE